MLTVTLAGTLYPAFGVMVIVRELPLITVGGASVVALEIVTETLFAPAVQFAVRVTSPQRLLRDAPALITSPFVQPLAVSLATVKPERV